MFAKPRKAATVAIIKDSSSGKNSIETLMLKRHADDRFLPSYYVFPGGAIDSQDLTLADQYESYPIHREFVLEAASHSGALAYFMGAIRETFEESGFLLACRKDEGYVEIRKSELEKYSSLRGRVYRGELAFSDFMKNEELFPALDNIFYYSRWITPPYSPIRYDTRFFIAPAPENQAYVHDGIELVESVWVEPAHALSLKSEGKMKLVMPTISTLEFLSRFESVSEVTGFLARSAGQLA